MENLYEPLSMLDVIDALRQSTQALDKAFKMTSNDSSNNPAAAAIEYALSKDCHGSEREFLNCWLHGEFDAIRREWENVPDEVFIGADPRLESTSENERVFNPDIPAAVREAVLVAIVECFEKHPEDISSTFTLTELVEVRDGTQHLLDENVQVESVYKRGFDALKN